MKKKLLYSIFLFFIFSVTIARANSIGFKVCNDSQPQLTLIAKFSDGHAEKPKPLFWHQCKTFPWVEVITDNDDEITSKKALDRVSIYSESKETNDNFFKHSFFFNFRHMHTADTLFIGRIAKRGICEDSLSKLLYTVHKSPPLSYHLKNYHYAITVHIKSDDQFNPEGNLQKNCDHINLNRKNNTISAWCHAPLKGHVQKYFFLLKGIDTLEALNKTSLWSTGNGFMNECGKPYQINHKKVVDCTVYPAGTGKSTAIGSYAKSCKLSYYDAHNNVLYAACPESQSVIHLYNYGHYWYIKNHNSATSSQLVYNMSKLDLNQHKSCKDIINKNGKLTCWNKSSKD